MQTSERWAAIRGGCVGAMAMTGVREVTTSLGLVDAAPPAQVAKHGLPGLFGRIPEDRRPAAAELAHWGFGTVLGAVYSVLPRAVRRHRLTGPAFGLATWAAFEAFAAPALGLPHATNPSARQRLAIAADHALFGAIVAGSHAAAEPRR